jgi:hypothetical protein
VRWKRGGRRVPAFSVGSLLEARHVPEGLILNRTDAGFGGDSDPATSIQYETFLIGRAGGRID